MWKTKTVIFTKILSHLYKCILSNIFLSPERFSRNCQAIYDYTSQFDGVYNIYVGPDEQKVQVYCSMDIVLNQGCVVSGNMNNI